MIKNKQMRWSHILWSDETKINLFGSVGVHVGVKHGGGRELIWTCKSAKGFIDGTMNVSLDTTLNERLPVSRSLAGEEFFQLDSDAKHTAKITQQLLKMKKVKTMT
uniref:Tc1-like transposase DDE domain-containing protein n=1 Tax=Seriola dumerili TaxID=41447 RepID=A0A3B4UEV1_SERDU